MATLGSNSKKRKSLEKEKKILSEMSLEEIEFEIAKIAMGKFKNPVEADLRLKALNFYWQAKFKRESLNKQAERALEPIKVNVVNPNAEDQQARIDRLNKEIRGEE